ncbi:MAG: YbfB/YjiJ family MFS transporter [Rhodoblastus sp.]|nr:YbfB/YjiJ family MFS transporter [Rhodoblastus sp.]MCB9999928.1 YbfB/YjiJ family MFS transporter [Methylobacteriaceae bacterium]
MTQPPSPARLAIGGMLAMASAFGIGRFVYTPILPVMIADGALTPASAGIVAAANFLGYLLGALAGASAATQRHPRLFFLGGLLAGGLSLAGMAAPPSIPVFSIMRFVGGFGSAFVIVCLSSMALEPLVRAGRIGLSAAPFAGVGFGIAFSSGLVSVLASAGVGWKAMWVANALVSTAMALLLFFLLPAPSLPAHAPAPAGRGGLPRISPALAALVVSYGLFGFGYVITATFLVAIVRETASLATLEPYAWAIVGLAGALSIPFWSWVARRTTDVFAYVAGCLVEATGVALSVVSPTPATIIISGIFLGGTFMAITAIGLGIARRLTQMAPQRAQAIMTSAFGLGQIVGPALAGHMRETSGSFVAPSLIAAAALVVAGALGAFVARSR